MSSLYDILKEPLSRCPRKVAIRSAGKSYTYEELKDRVDRLAAGLLDRGVRVGDRVAFIGCNSNASIELVLACAHIGAVCEQHNTRLAPRMIAKLLDRSHPRVVAIASDLVDSLHDEVLALTSKPIMLMTGRSACAHVLPREFLDYESLIERNHPLKDGCLQNEGNLALQMYTSGTTSVPKGVMLSHEAILSRISKDILALDFTSDDVYLCVLPLFHVTSTGVYTFLSLGAELVMAESSKPEYLEKTIRHHGVTRTGLVPCTLRDFLRHAEEKGLAVDSLRGIIYGGEPADARLLDCMHDVFPRCGMYQGYGMTETAGLITVLKPDDHLHADRLKTVGRPIPGVELRLVNLSGEVCKADEPGEVFVKTPTIMSGYLKDEERTAQVLNDGWYSTGDVGALSEDGYLKLLDRKNNMIITGGENVYPLEVVQCIESMGADIADAAVIGVPDDHWGEALVAFVVPASGSSITPEEIIDFCARELARYKRPKRVVFLESLERNAAGKISKQNLLDVAAGIR